MIDLSEIKKLPLDEKLRIIDALWESIDAEQSSNENEVNEEQVEYGIEEAEESPELVAMLEEKWSDIKNGKVKTVPAQDAEKDLFQFIAALKKDFPS